MQQEVQYREIEKDELTLELFSEFKRRQEVNLCWRREGGQWVIKEEPFIDDWSREDYQFLVQCLLGTIEERRSGLRSVCKWKIKRIYFCGGRIFRKRQRLFRPDQHPRISGYE